MGVTIAESGMVFGPFEDGNVFHIEKSGVYLKIQQSMRVAEFLVLQPHQPEQQTRKSRLLVVEAKSSSPRPDNAKGDFEKYIQEVSEKLNHALQLTLSLALRRHEKHQGELPDAFEKLDYALLDVVLVLVIKGHQDRWLPPLQDALRRSLNSACKIWNLQVVAINDKFAKKYGLMD